MTLPSHIPRCCGRYCPQAQQCARTIDWKPPGVGFFLKRRKNGCASFIDRRGVELLRVAA
jgi:hypothetical protein